MSDAADESLISLLVLGVVQGATEFLPVSSSGHLVLGGALLGMDHETGLTREIALHLGTLVAVVVFCWRDLLSMLKGGSAGLWRLVLGATVITGALGLSLKDTIETSLTTTTSAGVGLLITSTLLIVLAPKRDAEPGKAVGDGTWRDALLLGLFQSLALMPGVSRAGSTIVGALLLGFRRPDAVRVAFLISVPAVAGAVLLQAKEVGAAGLIPDGAMVSATVLAGLVGLGALRFISVRVDPVSLRRFGYYTLVLGSLALAVGLGLLGGEEPIQAAAAGG